MKKWIVYLLVLLLTGCSSNKTTTCMYESSTEKTSVEYVEHLGELIQIRTITSIPYEDDEKREEVENSIETMDKALENVPGVSFHYTMQDSSCVHEVTYNLASMDAEGLSVLGIEELDAVSIDSIIERSINNGYACH